MRKLTPSECLRLQGFDPSKFPKLSDSFLYQKAGNSVCVDMVEKILKEAFEKPPR
jgi:site-specific DNA-cytosine methylase